jgi:predicted TIM-barrel fold metal-dependent hydrolase
LLKSDDLLGYIDAHVHVWSDELDRYPISAPFQPADMNPVAARPEALIEQAQRSAVHRIVAVQMSYYGCDNTYLIDVMNRFPGRFAGIGIVDWSGSDPDGDMCALAKEGVKGFRVDAEGERGADCLRSEGLRKMFRCGQREGLAICFLMLPDALAAIAGLCARFPETPVVIDHLAQVGANGRILDPQISHLCALARFPQVKVKVSAFYALGNKRPPHQELAPFVRRVYEAFGPQRLMWGSDWPFQVTEETYDDSIALIRDRLEFLSRSDKEWLLRKTAQVTFFD